MKYMTAVRLTVHFNYRYMRVKGNMPCTSTLLFFLDTFVCTMFNFSINFRVLLTIRTDSHSHNAGKFLFHLVSIRNTLHFLPIATWAQCSLKEKKRVPDPVCLFSIWPIIIPCKVLATK